MPPQLLIERYIFADSSAYSLIRGSHEIWGQSLATFMISRPIYQGTDRWKFLELFISDVILQCHQTAMWTTFTTSFLTLLEYQSTIRLE